MVYFNQNIFNTPNNTSSNTQSKNIVQKDDTLNIIKGGAVKELKTQEEKEEIQLKRRQLENVSIIPQKPIKGHKISQDKINRFVNLKLKF